MEEVEIFNNFYEGMTPESKDLTNSSNGGDFSKLKVSEAKRVLERLVNAKRAYDLPQALMMRRVAANTTVEAIEDRIDARMDKFKKAILAALEKNAQIHSIEKVKAVTNQEETYPNFLPSGDQEFQAQANAAGNWNQSPSWNQWKIKDTPWRDNHAFWWSDPNTAQQPPMAVSYQQPPAIGYQQQLEG